MFLAQRDVLAAVGAFGFGSEGKPLAEVTKGFEIERDKGGVLSASAEDGQARTVQFEKGHLPAELAELLGAPRTGQSVIFPVLGNQEVIAVIYTDNGHLEVEIEGIEILELAAAQVGVAYENELLRRKVAS